MTNPVLPFPIADASVTAIFSQNTQRDMREIAWVENEDGVFDIENQYTVDGNEGNLEVIRSKIYITLSVTQGTWIPQQDFGIPISAFANYGTSPNVIASIIQDQILTVQNVNTVQTVAFETNASARMFSASYNVNTIYGQTQVAI